MVFSVSAYATGGDGWSSSSKGRIIVDKITIPSGDYQSFEFNTKGTGYKGFKLTDESDPNVQVLSPGKYSVSESVPIGWDLTSATCDSGTPSSISLTKGKTVRCTFVNTKWSNIVIIKYAYGNYSYNLSELFDSEKFNFTGTLGNFTIKTYFGLGAKAFVNITPGNYSVAELVPAGWNLVFTACSDGSPVSNIELKRGESIACIFKNKQAPQEATLTVTKTVVNDNGGTKTVFDFPLFVNGIPVVSGASNTLTPGMYIVSETNDPGYAASVWGGDCAPDGTITLAAGDNKTCTITNNDLPGTLTVIKHVINNNGGTSSASNFTMIVSKSTVYDNFNGSPLNLTKWNISCGDVLGCVPVVKINTTTQTFEIAQPTPHGISQSTATYFNLIGHNFTDGEVLEFDVNYTANVGNQVLGFTYDTLPPAPCFSCMGYWNGVVGDGNLVGNYHFKITFFGNGTILVDITKPDNSHAIRNYNYATNEPHFYLSAATGHDGVLRVDYDNFVISTPVNSFSGNEAGTNVTLSAGEYYVGENGPANYVANASTGCSGIIGNGETKICNITNDDIPASTTARLTVTKIVVNDNGGFLNALDFALMINGQFVSNGTPNVMNPGTYTVSEEQIQGYSATIGGDCAANGTVTLNAGQNKECIITNNDIPSNLTVVKIIINDNGGNAVLSDFTPLTINGNAVVNGTKNTLDSGVYRIGEANKPGYTATIGGDCAENGLVFIGLGEEKTCTITNNDDPAHILVIKNLINDRGGNNVESDFMMHITGTVGTFDFAGSSIGTNVVVNAGNYVVTEDPNIGPNFGYQSGLSADCTGTVTSGETKICTIINDDVAPTLTLVKNVTNNNGGTAGINNFGMTINGSPVISGEVFIAFSNTPYVIDEAGLAGYQFVNITGTGCPTQLGGTVTLNEGESVTCTITNDDVPGKVRIIKNTTGGDGTFNFTITGPSSSAPAVSTVNGSGDTTMSVNTSSYSVSESVPQGWNLTSAVCDSGTPGSFLVALNSTVTCTFENTKLPTLTVNKVLIPSNDTGLFNLQMDNITRITNVGDNGTTGPIIMSIGQHLVGELAGTNTTLGNYNSTIGGACAVNGSITLVAGQDAVCTITNTKIVV